MVSPLDVIRVNHTTWAWTSVAWTVDGMSSEGILAIDYEERLELRIVSSNSQDQIPLGMSLGRYQVGMFPVRMLRDAAKALKTYLTAKAPAAASGSYGQATFDMGLQFAGADAPLPSTVVFASCRIVGERSAHEEGTGAAVTEFMVACLAIVQDGNSLFDAPGLASAAMPWADTITIGGAPAPGKWTLLRAPRQFEWDVRKGYAMSGATTVPIGTKILVARFLVEVWDPKDFLAFSAFRKVFLAAPLVSVAGSPIGLALGIDHPELKAMGATSFGVQEVNPLLNDGFGVGMAEVEFIEYKKPGPAPSKADAAIPDTAAPVPTAKTQVQIELQKALAVLAAMPQGFDATGL